jgi:hypothetical protein
VPARRRLDRTTEKVLVRLRRRAAPKQDGHVLHFGSKTMRNRSFHTLIFGTALAFACAAAPLASQAQAVDPGTGTLPAMKVQGNARFACGGIGSDESTAMRAAMKDHPLALLFARAGGEYLANVDVTIKSGGGDTALAMRATGPVCLVDLPAGRYTVEANSEGVAKTHTVTLGRGSQTADFRF